MQHRGAGQIEELNLRDEASQTIAKISLFPFEFIKFFFLLALKIN